jgi:hypothetical protein
VSGWDVLCGWQQLSDKLHGWLLLPLGFISCTDCSMFLGLFLSGWILLRDSESMSAVVVLPAAVERASGMPSWIHLSIVHDVSAGAVSCRQLLQLNDADICDWIVPDADIQCGWCIGMQELWSRLGVSGR